MKKVEERGEVVALEPYPAKKGFTPKGSRVILGNCAAGAARVGIVRKGFQIDNKRSTLVSNMVLNLTKLDTNKNPK